MKKKKLKELSVQECKAICCDQPCDSCKDCPLWIVGTSTCIKDIKVLLEKEVELDDN